ncbi:AAA domain-containing protein [Vogesella indigofera]|uniref:AAA domain-containing protein n=1 Tax=Vogesella indigofera TaxID=45465 RepID=UPI00234E67E2|nr:AAA domain-containing protein [Vogesella indigofera]MDC7701683.1 AAA domain-containing protein [Vogesella indigofera]
MSEGKERLIEKENIVRYWHAVELLQPQSAPKLEKRSTPYGAYLHDTPIQKPILPWEDGSPVGQQVLPKNRIWSHTLYAHLYDSRLVADVLKEHYGDDQGYKEPQSQVSAVFAAKFTLAGHMVENSFVLSSEAWFLGRVLTGQDWTQGFEDDQKTAAEQAASRLAGRVSGDVLCALNAWVLQFLGVAEFFAGVRRPQFRFRSQPINPKKPVVENDPLNSFLLDDLAHVADSVRRGVTSQPLDQYLSRHDPQTRLHVDDDDASLSLIERLMPDAYANSCWPTERHLGLVHSQQLAVNTILSTLSDGQGLLGVNGPPGTGKTTLLRDLIAAIITSRADVLARLPRASDGFVSDGREMANDGGKQLNSYKLNPALYGFEIVVASSNNGAVENVTLELPQRDKIDESWLPDAEYFAELGALVSGHPAWGLISGALGSKTRRTQFVSRYFYGQRPFPNKDKEAEDEEDIDDESGEGIESLVEAQSADLTGEQDDGDRHDVGTPVRPDEAPKPQGFADWLDTYIERNKTLSSSERQTLWKQAVTEYEAVKADADRVSADACRIRALIKTICEIRAKLAEQTQAVGTHEQALSATETQLAHLDATESRPAHAKLKQCLQVLEQHQADKPGFWRNLISLWGAQRNWDARQTLLEGQRALASAEFARLARQIKQLETSKERLEKQVDEEHRTLTRLQQQVKKPTQDATRLATVNQAEHLLAWLQTGSIGCGEVIELAEPWRIEGWRQARARVFIQALKLHRTFFELEATRMKANLKLINSLLTGPRFRGLSCDAIRSAWASLFMVVPVLSSTFASFARSFSSLGVSEIGWLLVDEAGQAPPQAAVGALWRARRALLVGDPLQLKPIVKVSDAVLEHMRTHYRVAAHWLPNRQSAQKLADEVTPWGRMAGPTGSKTWVGLPLLVHRRCDRPMYELANRIAYDGVMVYGTMAPHAGKETPASLLTGWIDACGPSEGNWIPAEGVVLRELLARLFEDGVEAKDIAVITPFTAVRDNLRRIVKKKMISGTIHTMQGKEAAVVIMVLGGNTGSFGARDWAVSEPNLLNVAATRAKRRFYVIGDRSDWQNRALFCDVMDLLPPQRVSAIEQEQMSLPQ